MERLKAIKSSGWNDRFLIMLALGMIAALAAMFCASHSFSDTPKASAGILDLSDWDFQREGTVTLNGEWAFYPHQLLTPADFAKGVPSEDKRYMPVPSVWTGKDMKAYGYGTYRLQIKIKPTDQLFALHKQVVRFSDRLFIDGKQLASSGTPGPDRSSYQPGNAPYTVSFFPRGDRVDVIFQTANYEYPGGGITIPLRFGLSSDIQVSRMVQTMLEWAAAFILVLFAIFSLCLYFFFHKNISFLLFGAFFFFFALLTVLNGQRMLMEMFPVLPFEWVWRIKDMSVLVTLPFLYAHAALTYPPGKYRRVLFGLVGLFLLIALMVLVTPYHIYSWALVPIMMLYVLSLIGLTVFLIVFYRRADNGVLARRELQYYILAISALVLTSICAAFLNQGDGTFLPSVLSDLFGILFMVFIAIMLAYRYFQTFNQMVKLTDKLQAADQIKDELLLRTSHELNTPLHGIMNLSQALLDSAPSVPMDRRVNSRDKLQLIRNTAYRMSNLVNDIIDLSRIKDGRLEVQLKPVDLAACTAIAFEVYGYLANQNDVQLNNRIDRHAGYVYADERRLLQALSSLIDYGMKFSDLRGISVSSRKQGTQIVITVEVSVSGAGIPDASRNPDLFSASLAIADELIRLMGGELQSVVNEHHRGIKFEISLTAGRPSQLRQESLSREETAVSAEQAEELPVRGPDSGVYTVLVVDDELLHLELMVNLLTREGYRVITARTGEEALRMIESPQRPDIMLVDVLLAGTTSFEISRRIRQRHTPLDLPLLFVAARTTPADIEAGLAAGGNDFLSKPLDAGEVRVRIRTLLTMKRLAKEAAQSEMAFLQSQIKPHFLYNALGTIMSLCYTDGQRAGELLGVLSKYLRIIFHEDHKEESVLLRKEIELIRAYVDIEKARFGSRLTVMIDVDEALLGCKIMPLTIQPLVENAIRHGVAKRLHGGTVKLFIHRNEDEVEIVVEDNGVGMSGRQVQALVGNGSKGEGVGFANIMKRLAHLTGALPVVESTPNEGTKITIRLPYNTET